MMIVIAQENLMGEQIRFKHNSAAFFLFSQLWVSTKKVVNNLVNLKIIIIFDIIKIYFYQKNTFIFSYYIVCGHFIWTSS